MTPLYHIIIGINIIMGLIPLIIQKISLRNLVFFLFTTFLSLWILSVNQAWVTSNVSFWAKNAFTSICIAEAMMLLFLCIYPKQYFKPTPARVGALLIPGLVLAILSHTSFIIEYVHPVTRQVNYGMGYSVFITFFSLYMAAIFFILIRGTITYKGLDRLKFSYFITGFILFVTLASFTNLLLPLLGTNQYNKLGPLFSPMFIFPTLYAMLKYRLMDLRLIVSKSLAALITAALAITGFWATYNIANIFFPSHHETIRLAITATYWIVVCFIFPRLQLILQTTAEKTFLRGQYDYESSLADFSQALAKSTNLTQIFQVAQKHILSALESSPIRCYLIDSYSHKTTDAVTKYNPIKATGEKRTQLSPLTADDPLVLHLNKTKGILYGGSDDPTIQSVLSIHNARICVPIMNENKVTAFILLGPKLTQRAYTEQDFTMLTTLAAQLTIALERIKPFEQVKEKFEKSLEATEKMAQQNSFSNVTQGIAHEIRNPMAMILSGSEIIIDSKESPETVAQYADMIKSNILRLSDITKAMLKYGTDLPHPNTEYSLKEVIEELMIIMAPEAKKRHIDFKIKHNCHKTLMGDSHAIGQTLYNIITNGFEAIESEGTILITTSETTMVNEDRKTVPAAEIEIKDTGEGMTPEELKEAFTPFYTTKYENIGLGLSLALKTIRRHQGAIDIQSQKGVGTTVHILLPTK